MPSASTVAPLARYGGSYLLEAVQSFQHKDKTTVNPRDELKQYLNSVEPANNVVAWWGVSPFLAYISRILTSLLESVIKVSNVKAHRARLPCYIRQCDAIRVCLQQWGYYSVFASEQSVD